MGIWGEDNQLLNNSTKSKKNDIDIVRSAYRSILYPVAYVSTAIVSGKLCCEVLERKGVRSIDELVKKDSGAFYNDVIQPNIAYGISLAKKVAQMTKLPVIAPVVFEADKKCWSQNEYMFMWYRLLEEQVEELYMGDNWGYSNGSSQEFVRAVEMQFGFVNPDNGMCFFPNYEHFKNEKKNLKKEFSRVFKIIKEADEEYVKSVQSIDSSVKLEERINLCTTAGLKFKKRVKEETMQKLAKYLEALTALQKKYSLVEEHERMKKIKIYTASGGELKIDRGVSLLASAVKDLKRRSLSCDSLFKSLHKLVSIGAYFYDYLTPSNELPPYEYDFGRMKEEFESAREF